MNIWRILLLSLTLISVQPAHAQPASAEGPLAPFLSKPSLQITQAFERERMPNIVVTIKGTVVATFGTGSVVARRSEDGGKTWGDVITIAKPGFQGGGTTVDESTGHLLAFVEDRHPPAPLTVYRSKDDGKTWAADAVTIKPDAEGRMPSMHMNEHGITLRHGENKGRLLRPSRWYAGKNERSRWPDHFTNAVYSDDGGKTWNTSAPFPANGTGEATVAELSDGTIYYNSRRHWAPDGESPLRRWSAISKDGGQTWEDLTFVKVLPDGPQNTNYGCMGGLIRLPVAGQDILVYTNCDSPNGRDHGTAWVSFDGGKCWPIKRQIFEGRFAYSSVTAGFNGTPSEGNIYCHFEGGPSGASSVAVFNLSWLLGGEKTGNGTVPKLKID